MKKLDPEIASGMRQPPPIPPDSLPRFQAVWQTVCLTRRLADLQQQCEECSFDELRELLYRAFLLSDVAEHVFAEREKQRRP